MLFKRRWNCCKDFAYDGFGDTTVGRGQRPGPDHQLAPHAAGVARYALSRVEHEKHGKERRADTGGTKILHGRRSGKISNASRSLTTTSPSIAQSVDTLDPKVVEKAVAEIHKCAARLQVNLMFPKETATPGEKSQNEYQMSTLLSGLSGLIKRFVNNPVFGEVEVLDVQAAATSRNATWSGLWN